MTHTRIQVSAEAFARALICMSTEETRYYLNGVFVTPCETDTGVLLASTDGHRMSVIRDPNGVITGPTQIVRLEKSLIKELKQGRKETLDRLLIVEAIDRRSAAVVIRGNKALAIDVNPLTDLTHELIIAVQPREAVIDGSFPDWRRIIPKVSTPSGGACYNTEYIRDLGAALNKGASRNIRIAANDASSPALVYGSDENSFGILMPIKSDPPGSAPFWHEPKSEQSLAA